MLRWLGDELSKQQQKMEASERALAEYREKENALSLDDKQNIVVSRLNALNDSATKSKMERVQKETVYNQVTAIASGTAPDAIPIIAQNLSVSAAKNKLLTLCSIQREHLRFLSYVGLPFQTEC